MNWLTDRLKQMENEMSDTGSNTNIGDAIKSTIVVPAPVVLTEDQMQKLAGMVASQLQGLVKVVAEDCIKGNFSGAWDDVKKTLVNAGIADAIQATRVLEQEITEHIAGLGNSKQLDIAKGKISDAFIWIEKHLGIGG